MSGAATVAPIIFLGKLSAPDGLPNKHKHASYNDSRGGGDSLGFPNEIDDHFVNSTVAHQ